MAETPSDVHVWEMTADAFLATVRPKLNGFQRLLALERLEAPQKSSVAALEGVIAEYQEAVTLVEQLLDILQRLVMLGFPATPRLVTTTAIENDLTEDRTEIDLALEEVTGIAPTTSVTGKVGPQRPTA